MNHRVKNTMIWHKNRILSSASHSGWSSRWRLCATLGLMALVALALTACNKNGPKDKPPISGGNSFDGVVVGPVGKFSHEKHLGLLKAKDPCQSCHTVGDDDLVQRPGSNQHQPCSNSGCHYENFTAPPDDFCSVCHAEVNPLVKDASEMFEYPRPGRVSAVQNVVAFDHKKHLKLNQDCSACHTVVADPSVPYATLPRHKECKSCHSKNNKLLMENCKGCHSARSVAEPKRFVTNEIRFTHGKHFADNAGQISCKTCHADIFKSSNAKDRGLPSMKVCEKCHNDSSRVRRKFRTDTRGECTTCHVGDDFDPTNVPENHRATTAQLEPEVDPEALEALGQSLTWESLVEGSVAVVADINGMVATERNMVKSNKRPQNHTTLFRKNHAEAAASPNSQCYSCHAGLSGAPRDSCMECHSVWRPRNHTLRWRGLEHGRQAARNPEACSTCHQSEFCTECHNIPPPSHSPLNVFRSRHARQARFNTRSCLTCHSFETTCSECHILDVIPFGDDQFGLEGQ